MLGSSSSGQSASTCRPASTCMSCLATLLVPSLFAIPGSLFMCGVPCGRRGDCDERTGLLEVEPWIAGLWAAASAALTDSSADGPAPEPEAGAADSANA